MLGVGVRNDTRPKAIVTMSGRGNFGTEPGVYVA